MDCYGSRKSTGPIDGDCRQGIRLFEQKIARRNHDLLGFKPELHSDLLHRVDRGPIYIGLAGLTQSPLGSLEFRTLPASTSEPPVRNPWQRSEQLREPACGGG